jgi:hypothetical protein
LLNVIIFSFLSSTTQTFSNVSPLRNARPVTVNVVERDRTSSGGGGGVGGGGGGTGLLSRRKGFEFLSKPK